jgi:hypothetical protein
MQRSTHTQRIATTSKKRNKPLLSKGLCACGQKTPPTGKLFDNQALKRETDRDFGRVVLIESCTGQR